MSETTPPTRMGKIELKNALIAFGYTEEQLSDDKGKAMKRPALLEMLKDHQQGEKSLDIFGEIEEDNDIGIEIEPDTKVVIIESSIDEVVSPSEDCNDEDDTDESELKQENLEPVTLTPNDEGWTQFVLGKFMDDEVDGKNPRVEGLRRIAGELVGELIEEGCDLIAVPTEDNRFRACAKAWGIFLTPGGQTKRFEALADANSENCFEDYATYLVAMADTRAKGRMFRNALCLRRVVSAEEVSKTMASTADTQSGGAIHTGQISMIRMMSDRQNINIAQILDGLGIDYKLNEQTGDVNLNSLSYEDALRTAKAMREQREEQVKKEGGK